MPFPLIVSIRRQGLGAFVVACTVTVQTRACSQKDPGSSWVCPYLLGGFGQVTPLPCALIFLFIG